MSEIHSTQLSRRIKDLTGQRFGRLTVLKFFDVNKHQSARWLCRCDCGKETIVVGNVMKKGDTKSCGCLHKQQLMDASKSRCPDLRGQIFGKLTVLWAAGSNQNGRQLWWCRCECGVEKIFLGNHLISGSGKVKSCGCYRFKKHGHASSTSKTRTYQAWSSMKKRCKQGSKDHANYFDRGISVCARWGLFKNFLADMGECPDGYELDRIDNNQSYYPSNCRWVNESIQRRNQRKVIQYEHNGQKMLLIDWARHIGITYNTLIKRIHTGGWSFEKAITTPVKKSL